AIGHMNEVDASHHLKELAGDMDRGSDTARRHVDFARVDLGIGDKLGNGVGWNRWVELHDERHADDARHRRDVAYEIEVEVVIECHIDRIGRSDLQKRIAVRRCLQGCLSADIAGGTRPVLYYELLAEALWQPLRHQARHNVGRAASGKPNDDAHGTGRVGLPPRTRRYGGESGGTGRQMQKLTPRKCHRLSLPNG